MKNIIKLFTFPLLTIIGFNSCASIPLKIESLKTTPLTLSAICLNMTVARYIVFTIKEITFTSLRGDVTSITNDSTAQRTITINKTPYE